jgi:hypothetical protein
MATLTRQTSPGRAIGSVSTMNPRGASGPSMNDDSAVEGASPIVLNQRSATPLISHLRARLRRRLCPGCTPLLHEVALRLRVIGSSKDTAKPSRQPTVSGLNTPLVKRT